MSLSRTALLLPPLLVLGCFNKDTDGDGITDKEEEELGLDPESADSDNDGLDDEAELSAGTDPVIADSDEDGLLDGEESNLGTNPLATDSDADGYLDSWEVVEGTDPVDADSRIYAGNWPYNPDKDSLDAPGYDDARLQVGEAAPRFVLMDQHGDMVDLYDFYNQDAYIILDLSAMWCPPCNGFSAWLSGDPKYVAAYDAEWPNLREKVANGEVYWLTVLGEDNRGNVPDIDDLNQWVETYPDDHIPVMTVEDDRAFTNFFLDGGWPSIYLLNPDLTIHSVPGNANDYTEYYKALFEADAL